MIIKAITFDFWSTLYHYTQSPRSKRLQSIQSALASTGRDDITEEQIAAAMQHAWDIWDRIWRTEHRTTGAGKWLTLVLDDVGATLPASVFAQTARSLKNAILADITVPVEGAPQALARLSKHYRLGIISDTGLAPGQTLRNLLQRDGLLPYFTHFTFSDELGRSKPHPDLFLAALDGLNALPHQAAHIGDLRHTDIFGARGVGMVTVRYAGIRDDRDAAYPEADIVVKNYDKLLQHFCRPKLES